MAFSTFKFECGCGGTIIKGIREVWWDLSKRTIQCGVCSVIMPTKIIYDKIEQHTGCPGVYTIDVHNLQRALEQERSLSTYDLWTGPEGRKILYRASELKQIMNSLEKIDELIRLSLANGKNRVAITVARALLGFPQNTWLSNWSEDEFKIFTNGIHTYLGKRYKVETATIWPAVKDIILGKPETMAMEVYQVELFPKP